MIDEGLSYPSSISTQSIGIAIFNEIKNKNPHTTALVDGESGEEISYKAVLHISVNLATTLSEMGLGKNSTMAIISENTWKYPVAAISGWYIGAKILFLNPDYVADELRHFLAICPTDLIFCSQKSLNAILTIKDEVTSLKKIVTFDCSPVELNIVETFDSLIDKQKCDDFHPVEADLDEIAGIYTSSGTTGFPKCVPLSHSNIIVECNVFGNPKFFLNGTNETTLSYLPFFHIYGNIVFLTSIIYGIKMVVMPKFRTNQFFQFISEYKITRLYTVPTVLVFIVKNSIDEYDLSSVKDIIAGGSVITPYLENMVKDKMNLKVRQIYGMTETTAVITMVPKELPYGKDKPGSVGTLVSTCKIKVTCPKTGKNLGPNQVGEIRVTGPGIFKGYYKNQEATFAAFDDDGFLKTGDLGYLDEDSFLYIVGRSKEIIKYKSFQVSPTELEHLLLKHPSVKEAAVVGKHDEVADEVAVALVVKQPGCEVTEAELVDYVKENVSVQKHLHGGVKFVDEIPKTGSNKICRSKLKELL